MDRGPASGDTGSSATALDEAVAMLRGSHRVAELLARVMVRADVDVSAVVGAAVLRVLRSGPGGAAPDRRVELLNEIVDGVLTAGLADDRPGQFSRPPDPAYEFEVRGVWVGWWTDESALPVAWPDGAKFDTPMLVEALRRIPLLEAAVLVVRYTGDLDALSVARVLGTDPEQVTSLVELARRNLVFVVGEMMQAQRERDVVTGAPESGDAVREGAADASS